MDWVNPDWFLWGGFIFCTVVHLLYWAQITNPERTAEHGELIFLTWLISGAFLCLLGYLAFSSLQA